MRTDLFFKQIDLIFQVVFGPVQERMLQGLGRVPAGCQQSQQGDQQVGRIELPDEANLFFMTLL
jgi:hypothetical protein